MSTKIRIIKPIETVFNGHRFRSRLEARWAVFFEELKIKYEYEIECYKLPSGLQYMPDFWLPELGCFIEVKPSIDMSKKELEKMVEFALSGGKNLVLFVGYPTTQSMVMINNNTTRPVPKIEKEYREDRCPEDGPTTDEMVVDYFFSNMGDYLVKLSENPLFGGSFHFVYESCGSPKIDHDLFEAMTNAKQSRFEFGESGSKKRR